MKINKLRRISDFNLFTVFKIFVLVFVININSQKLSGQSFPGYFGQQLFMSGWTDVEGFRFDATNQMYVWEKGGKVWVVDTNGVKLTTPLLNISDEVGNWRDHGLNGFALDPNFRTNGYYYLFYTVDRHHLLYYGTANYNALTNTYYNATISRVTRYTADSATNFTTTVAGSRLVLIGESKKTGIPLLHESHSGGQLVFGTDGSLLICTGDGASYSLADGGSASGTYFTQALNDSIIKVKENVGAFRSQLVDCLNGKVLRINPATGDGLASNPYYDATDPRSAKSRVWCLGLRNPFRMCLRPGTGSSNISSGDPGVLYIGDVGWGTFEDLNVASGPGMNFGWPLFEGFTPMSSYVGLTVYNRDAVNPLYPSGGCTQQFFQFKNLCIQDTLTANPSWPNPCNASQQIPSTILRFKHARPAIDWQHGSAHTRTGIWNGSSASQIDLNNVLSPVPGPVFAGNAAVGGAWYNGIKYPPEYQNTYFGADYGQGWIKNFKFHSDNTPDSVKDFGNGLGAVVFLEYNPKDQLLYFIKYPSEIYKITYTPPVVNMPPTAVALSNVHYGLNPLTVNFTGSNSTDPENIPLSYTWNYGDGTPLSNLPDPVHVYNAVTSEPVNYTVTLTVTDNWGNTSTANLTIYYNNTPPQVNIISFNDGDLFTQSYATLLPLEAYVTDAQSADSLLIYAWETALHHNTHEHPEPPDNQKVTYTVLTPVGCDDSLNTYYFRVKLTVTDPYGLSATTEGNLYPACNLPVAAWSANKSKVCVGSAVNFTDNSANLPDSLFWSFPGGTPSVSTAKNPNVTYNTVGIYDVALIAKNFKGVDTLISTGFINVVNPPAASVRPNSIDTMCSTGKKILRANKGVNLAYQWLNDGIEISGADSFAYTATAAGTYRVLVKDTISGCSSISVSSEKIVIQPLQAYITALGPTTFCNGDSVMLRANAGSYIYQWRNNGVIPGATGVEYSAKVSGSYAVRLTDAGGCKLLSSKIKVIVNCREGNSFTSNQFDANVSPNPAYDKATMSVSMPEKGNMDIGVFDLIGNKVAVYEKHDITQPGIFEIDLSVSNLSSGVYFIRVSNGKITKDLKLIIGAH